MCYHVLIAHGIKQTTVWCHLIDRPNNTRIILFRFLYICDSIKLMINDSVTKTNVLPASVFAVLEFITAIVTLLVSLIYRVYALIILLLL